MARRQVIIWTKDAMLSIKLKGTYFSEIVIENSKVFIQENAIDNVIFEIVAICLGLSVLIILFMANSLIWQPSVCVCVFLPGQWIATLTWVLSHCHRLLWDSTHIWRCLWCQQGSFLMLGCKHPTFLMCKMCAICPSAQYQNSLLLGTCSITLRLSMGHCWCLFCCPGACPTNDISIEF